MPKFCAECGSSLEEGQVCACRQAASIQTGYAIPKEGPSELVVFFKGMFELFKSFVKKPTLITKMAAQKQDFKAGLFYLGIQSLITALFATLVIGRVTNAISGSLGILGGFLGGGFYGLYDVQYFGVFIKVFAYTAIQFFLISGLVFGVGKVVYKTNGCFKALIGAMGVASIPASVMLLVGMILIWVLPSMVIYFIILAILSTLLLNFIAVRETLGASEDRSFWILIISNVVYYFIVFNMGIKFIVG